MPANTNECRQISKDDWSVYEAWKEDWFKKEVSNQFLITDPAICLLDFDLERKDWTLLNRFRTGRYSP